MIRVAIDCMGGDVGCDVTVPASLKTLISSPEPLRFVLVGNEKSIRAAVPSPHQAQFANALASGQLSIVHTDEHIAMDESAAVALRSKRNSSMRLAIQAVKDERCDAVVSAGNTGALLAVGRFVLKTLPGVDRPALCADVPRPGGASTMLDLGANLDCSADHLLKFACMGAAFAHAVRGIERPSVGVLNVGSEDIKGNEQVKAASVLIAASGLNFVGNIEGSDIYKPLDSGGADVIVCDGFVGNVSLKTAEGLAAMIAGFIKEEFNRGWRSKLAGLLSKNVLARLKTRVDHRRYNGGCLLGLRGVVFKSHGSADSVAFEFAIARAIAAVKNNLLAEITQLVDLQLQNANPMGTSTDVNAS